MYRGRSRREVVATCSPNVLAGPPPVTAVSYDVVVPTIGRPSLDRMLRALAAGDGPWPEQLIVVDDRPPSGLELELPAGILPMPVTVLRAAGNGPAAARNLGWRAGSATWTVFLDDDVLPDRAGGPISPATSRGLERLDGGSQGRIVVPRPPSRRTDGLGTQRRRTCTSRAGPRRTWPIGGPRWSGSAASTSASRAPTGRTPISPCGSGRPGFDCVPASARRTIPCGRPRGGQRPRPGRERRRHADAARPRPAVAATGRGRPGVDPPARAHDGSRRARRRRAALRATARPVGRRRRRRRSGSPVRRPSRPPDLPGPRTAAEIAAMVATSLAIPPVATWHLGRGWSRARAASCRDGGRPLCSSTVTAR